MKKIILIIVAIVLVMSIAITATYASISSVKTTSASSTPEFAVESTSGKIGDTVSVNVMVKNNPGITALQLNISYSAKDLELVSIENGGLFNDAITHSKLDKNPIIISWYSSSSENESANGCLATLNFKVLEGATNSNISITYDEENIFNSSFNNVKFNMTAGVVSVNSFILGDVDGDEKVTIMDATMIQRHIAQLAIISEEKMKNADTDKDAKITIMDATVIQRFIAQLIPEL